MKRRLLPLAAAGLLFGASLVLVGCGSSTPTAGDLTDKQKTKEKMPPDESYGPKKK
jgi:hypothetical protein